MSTISLAAADVGDDRDEGRVLNTTRPGAAGLGDEVDLIVVGSRGHGAPGQWILGRAVNADQHRGGAEQRIAA